MSDFKYVENLNLVLSDRTDRDEEDYPGEYGLALAAYNCNDGCIDEGFWDVTELMTEIIRKYRYALIAVLIEKGYTQDGFCSDYDIIIEPCHEDATQYVVIRRSDMKVLCSNYHKAWNFGYHADDDEEENIRSLEDFLEGLASEFTE